MIILDTHSEMVAHAHAIEEMSNLLKYMQSTNSLEVTHDVLKEYFTPDIIHEIVEKEQHQDHEEEIKQKKP